MYYFIFQQAKLKTIEPDLKVHTVSAMNWAGEVLVPFILGSEFETNTP